MKIIKILSLVLLVGLFTVSCSDDESTEPTTVNYTLGTGNLSETNTFNTGSSTMVSINLTTSDLCPDSGVRVIISVGGVEQYNELIETFNFTLDVTTSENADMNVETSIEGIPGSPVVCITLGSVDCTLEY